MRFFFRPLSASALHLKKRCFDLAMTLRKNGVIRRIEEGFIVEVVRKGDQLIATVIDMPTFFVCSRALYQKALNRPPYGFSYKARDAFAPVDPTPAIDALALSTDTLKLYQAPYPTVVGSPPSIGNAAAYFFPAQLRASAFKAWACLGLEAAVADAGQLSGYQAAMDVTLACFSTPITSYTDYPAEVNIGSRSAWGRLVVAESGVRAILGDECYINPTTAYLGGFVGIHSFRGFAAAGLLLLPPDEDSPAPKACVLATPIYKPLSRPTPTSRAPECGYSLLVGMVQLSEPVAQDGSMPAETQAAGSFAWHVELFASGETFIADIGMASDGATATAVVVRLDSSVVDFSQTYTYNVTRFWFNSAGLQGSETLYSISYPSDGAGTSKQLWLDIGEAGGAAYSVVLDAVQTSTTSADLTGAASIAASKGGQTIIAALPGWRPFTTVSRGSQGIFGAATGLNDPVRTSVVVDLGEGDIAVVAAPSSQLGSSSGSADWRLIVLDKETLAFIEARGLIASLYWQPNTYSYAFQSIGISVITKQVKNEQGEVVTPAVLLASYTSQDSTAKIRLSTDGGATWQDMVNLQTPADTFYIGNRLHQVVLGEDL